jgi:hypothetical protein
MTKRQIIILVVLACAVFCVLSDTPIPPSTDTPLPSDVFRQVVRVIGGDDD